MAALFLCLAILASLGILYFFDLHNRQIKIKMMRTLLLFIDSKDQMIYTHSLNVGAIATLFAIHIGAIRGMKAAFFEEVAKIHDIGKVSIPDSVLQKQGRLTPEEYKIVKRHPLAGEQILLMLLGHTPYRFMISHHHERFDGSGYPFGLSAEQIPFFGRLLAIADTFEALSSERPFRKACELSEVLTYMKSEAGTHFDPQLLDKFLAWMDVLPILSFYLEENLRISVKPMIYFISCNLSRREMVLSVEVQRKKYQFILKYEKYDWQIKRVTLESASLPTDAFHLII